MLLGGSGGRVLYWVGRGCSATLGSGDIAFRNIVGKVLLPFGTF